MSASRNRKNLSLSVAERRALFALSAYKGRIVSDAIWAKILRCSPSDKKFTEARNTLLQKGIVKPLKQLDPAAPKSYRIFEKDISPNFFICEVPDLKASDNDKLIELKGRGGLENINLRFFISRKHFHTYRLMPGQKLLCTLPDFHQNTQLTDDLLVSDDACVIINPHFSFTDSRMSYKSIGSATRRNARKLRIEGDSLKGIVDIKTKGVKRDCLYKIEITQNFSPFAPRAKIYDPLPVYNPHQHKNNFKHLMGYLGLPLKHSAKTEKDANLAAKTAGPYIKNASMDKKFIISIDDAGTRCIDDALSLEKTDNGFIQETYLVATPCFFDVGSDLYQSALNFGQTLYIGTHDKFSNIPTVISDGVGSLHAGQDCPVIVLRTEYDKDGRIINADSTQRFRKDVISVNANITPEDFKRSVSANDPRFTVYKEFMALRAHMHSQKNTRPLHGIFNQVSETGYYSRALVEDRMVNVNYEAGKFLDSRGLNAGYRNFSVSITPAKYDAMRFKLFQLDPRLIEGLPDSGFLYKSSDLISVMNKASHINKSVQVESILRGAFTNSSAMEPINRGHGDIGVEAYAPISSSARRHNDFINQSIMLHELGHHVKGVEALYDFDNLKRIGAHLSDVELRHGMLFKNAKQRKARAIMKERAARIESATITHITPYSIAVHYDDYGVSDYFNNAALGQNGFEIDGDILELVMPASVTGQPSKKYCEGGKLNVQIDKSTDSLYNFTQIIPE